MTKRFKLSPFALVKRIVLVFLAAIVLGFIFNQSIANYFIPKVSYTFPQNNVVLLDKLPISGVLKARRTLPVALAGAASIVEVYKPAGSAVKSGDPLFKVVVLDDFTDDSSEDLQVLTQQSVLNQLMAQRDTLLQDIAQGERDLANAQRDYQSTFKLYNSGAVAKTKLDSALNEKSQAAANLAALRIQYEKVVQDIELAQQKLQVIQSADDAEYSDDIYQIDQDGVCRAKFDGVVMQLAESFSLQNGGDALAKIAPLVDFEDVYCEMYLDYCNVDKLQLEQTLALEDANANRLYRIRISAIEQIAVDNKVRVLADVVEAEGQPILNLRLNGEVVTRSAKHHIVIAKRALLNRHAIQIGAQNAIFAIEKSRGVLGDEYYLKRVDFTIKDVGERNVAVEQNIFSFDEPNFIVDDISYLLKDEQRVLMLED